MSEIFRNFAGRVLDNDLSLTECIGGTSHTAVFKGLFSGQTVAVKLFAVDTASIDRQLADLQLIEKLSHPHLLRVLKTGQSELDGTRFAYVVTEFAEENLAQVLSERALTPPETREVLQSTLDVLTYLHAQGLVHSNLKPANILAIGDRLKISAESVGRNGDPLRRPPEAHDAPEAFKALSPASDAWSLGMTIVEVLTQLLPPQPANENTGPAIPDTVPAPFREIAQHCLLRTPELRWSLDQISAKLNPQSATPPPIVPAARVEAPAPPPTRSLAKRALVPVTVLILVVAVIVILGHRSSTSQPPAATPAETQTPVLAQAPPERSGAPASSAPSVQNNQPDSDSQTNDTSAPPVPASQESRSPAKQITAEPSADSADDNSDQKLRSANAGDGVMHQVMPSVSRQAQRSIQGTVRVKLSLDVDSNGKVQNCSFVSHGPSQYFAKAAEQAARRWTFAPSSAGSRSWNLEFDFHRSGTTVRSKAQNTRHNSEVGN